MAYAFKILIKITIIMIIIIMIIFIQGAHTTQVFFSGVLQIITKYKYVQKHVKTL